MNGIMLMLISEGGGNEQPSVETGVRQQHGGKPSSESTHPYLSWSSVRSGTTGISIISSQNSVMLFQIILMMCWHPLSWDRGLSWSYKPSSRTFDIGCDCPDIVALSLYNYTLTNVSHYSCLAIRCTDCTVYSVQFISMFIYLSTALVYIDMG